MSLCASGTPCRTPIGRLRFSASSHSLARRSAFSSSIAMKALIFGCHAWILSRQAFVTSTELTRRALMRRAMVMSSKAHRSSDTRGCAQLRGAEVRRLVVERQRGHLLPQQRVELFELDMQLACALGV